MPDESQLLRCFLGGIDQRPRLLVKLSAPVFQRREHNGALGVADALDRLHVVKRQLFNAYFFNGVIQVPGDLPEIIPLAAAADDRRQQLHIRQGCRPLLSQLFTGQILPVLFIHLSHQP